MTQSRFFTLCLLTVAGAFAGGYAANLSVPVVHAQLIPPAGMRATSFVLVDP